MIRPFRLVSSRDLETICARVLSVADTWARHWLPASAGLTVVDARAATLADAWCDVQLTGSVADDGCAIRVEPPHLRRLGAALLGDDAHAGDTAQSAIVDDLCRRALGALAARLAGADEANEAAPAVIGDVAQEALAPGNGAVVVALEAGDANLEIMLAQAITSSWLETSSPAQAPAATLSPPRSALGRQRLSAACGLDDTELELGALAGLAIGDVIRLDHPLDRPLRLRFRGADVTCEGYLCERGTRDAIMLARKSVD